MNAPGAGQFEHTLIIIEEGAKAHFIEGCSAPKYNVANLHAGCVELFVKDNATLRYSTIENGPKTCTILILNVVQSVRTVPLNGSAVPSVLESPAYIQ